MDDLQFRRGIYADPKTTDADLLAAMKEDPAKQKFAQELISLDDKILNALNVSVPEDLSEKLILRQSLASHQQQKKRSRVKLAIAASITFALGLTFNFLQFSNAYTNVGDYAIAHVNHEAEYFTNTSEANITLASLNKKMASFNGSFSENLGELMMADYCRFDGMKSLHLVFKGQSNPVNIFIIPNSEHLEFNPSFKRDELKGSATNYNKSHIIVVGDETESLQQWQERIAKNVRWSA
ncbi:DUF3379 domain-containing protein [bacterium]|nr:DUF3379 domain-containing protein [bacterium]